MAGSGILANSNRVNFKANNIIITGNTITNETAASNCISISGSDTTNGVDGFTISNNTVKNCVQGISIAEAINGTITGSTIVENTEKGMISFDSTYLDITGNTIANNSTGGGADFGLVIQFTSDTDAFTTIANNNITDNIAGTSQRGLYL